MTREVDDRITPSSRVLPEFPDEAHLRQLRSLLWASGGRATVMVGAGMGRNAIPLRSGSPPMPLWSDLATAMAKIVWPGGQKRRGGDSLVLAEYFERLHKRPALEEFLRSEIRDESFLPGRLHVLLMALPWVDVFTTNYDTLLERACEKVIERRYSAVVNQSDLANARQPRIVKLNGSFPSHRPFTITQEDFRTYPRNFAAFVNTVQQAIMETAVCMIGFSGDDPNFQAWTGWVRDNLGPAAPPLYHCDVLDLDVARRSYYEARNIRPIDLGPLFPPGRWESANRRSAALEWFILSLAEGAPADIDDWPSVSRRKPALPISETLLSRSAARRPWRVGPDSDDPTSSPRAPAAWDPTADIPILLGPDDAFGTRTESGSKQSAFERIAALRQSYPGWLLSPIDIVLEHMVTALYHDVQVLGPKATLDQLACLSWGLAAVNWPWPDEFLALVEAELARLHAGVYSADALDLIRSLVREARERDEPERFSRWMESWSGACGGNPVAVAEWWIEKAKFHFLRLEFNELKLALQHCSAPPSRPFLDVTRAGLQFELGNFSEAAVIAAATVDRLRRDSDPRTPSPRLAGEETSALDVATTALFSTDGGFVSVGGNHPRRRELRRVGNDPRDQLELRGAELSKLREPSQSLTKNFDPGMWSTTIREHFGHRQLLPFRYLRALDDSSQLPTNHQKHVTIAASSVVAERPGWAFLHLLRAHADLDQAFSRDEIIAFSPDVVTSLWQRCERFVRSMLENDWSDITRDNDIYFLSADRALELLSRLTIRADRPMRAQCVNLVIDLHESRDLHRIWRLRRPLISLFERCFASMPLDEQTEALPRLVRMSVHDFGSETVYEWRDPCAFIDALDDRLISQQSSLAGDAMKLAVLLGADNGSTRSIAMTRLNALDKAGGLDGASRRAYAEALWSHLDPHRGIPVVDGFSLHVGLLVTIDSPNAKQRFKAWVLGGGIPLLYSEVEHGDKRLRQSQYHWVRRHLDAIERASVFPWSEGPHVAQLIDWSADEAQALLRICEVWLESASGAIPLLPGPSDRDLECVDLVARLIADVVVPRLNLPSEPSLRSRLDAINVALRSISGRSLAHYPSWLIVEPEASVASHLRMLLSSREDEAVRTALGRVFEWVGYAKSGRISPVPDDLVDYVFILTSSAPDRALSSAFTFACNLYLYDRQLLNDRRREWVRVAVDRLFRGDAENHARTEIDVPEISFAADVRASAARMLTTLAALEPGNAPWRELADRAELDSYPEVRAACETAKHRLSTKGVS